VSGRQHLEASLAKHSEEAAAWKSPMYSEFCTRMRDDVAAGGPTWRLLEPYAAEPADEYYELAPDVVRCELRLTIWPRGEERLLARGDVHLAPVEWLE